MNALQFKRAGLLGLLGALSMIAGAIVWGLSGADLDAALLNNEMGAYLSGLDETASLIIVNLSFWLLGVFLMGVAGFMLAKLTMERFVMATLAQFSFIIATATAIVSFIGMASIVTTVAPGISELDIQIAMTVGWFASRVDWLATALIVGFGPAFLAAAGHKIWVPNWLRIWSYLCAIAGFLTLLAIYGGGLTTYGFVVVPIGLLWMIAAAIVLLRMRGGSIKIKVE